MAGQKDDRIRERAHAIWEREGRPDGREQDHWEQARREVENEESADRSGAGSSGVAARGSETTGGAGRGASGASGLASGLQQGGASPAGGPASTQGSVGTGGGSTAGRPTGGAGKTR